jgi:O-antigen ligase
MTPEHMIALAGIPLFTVAASLAAACSRRVRAVFFVAILGLCVFTERMQVNFFSEAWYRGTTRGIQVSLVEMLAFALLFGCWTSRRLPGRRLFWPGSLGLLLLYFLYCCFSVAASQPKVFGAFELSKILASILVFAASAAYVRTRSEWTLLLVTLGCVVGFEGIWALKQHFLMHLERAAGTLDHANSLSMFFCMATPPLVAFACCGWSRLLKLFCGICAGFAAVGLLLTYSRAGIPVFATAVGGTVLASWRLRAGKIVLRTLILAGAAALVAACWGEMQRRYSEASFQEEYFDPTIDGRGVYLRLSEAIAKDHFFGVGLNNWSYYVSSTYGPRLGYRFVDYDYLISIYGSEDDKLFSNSYLAAPAHNLGALTLGELGVPGLLLFSLLWVRWVSLGLPFLLLPRADPMRAVGVGLLFSVFGIFGQSFTEWVYRQTPILFTFYVLLGALASLAHDRRVARAESAQEPAGGPVEPARQELAAGSA